LSEGDVFSSGSPGASQQPFSSPRTPASIPMGVQAGTLPPFPRVVIQTRWRLLPASAASSAPGDETLTGPSSAALDGLVGAFSGKTDLELAEDLMGDIERFRNRPPSEVRSPSPITSPCKL